MPRVSMKLFGTEFENLDDEDRDSVSKKPLSVENQLATDEKGRRRFHGAFTGGFSAGYFNTVGTKHGWVPQTFKSSREDRAEKETFHPEDFMDDEDMGEFGIAPRQIRTARDFVEDLGLEISGGPKRRLAWEHSSADSKGNNISFLEEIVKPIGDSIGIRLLCKMGWRIGQGIGPKMSKLAIERQKASERRSKSGSNTVEMDLTSVTEMDEMAPGFEFAPQDVNSVRFESKMNMHGLGYRALGGSAVLEQKYGTKEAGFKGRRGREIRGQAFGVGAFEAEDTDIYTNEDISQYDYALGESASSFIDDKEQPKFGFVASKQTTIRLSHFYPPKTPINYVPQHHPLKTPLDSMSASIRTIGGKLTPLERARLLGEGDLSVMSLLKDRDRRRLEGTRSRWQHKEEEMENRKNKEGGGGTREEEEIPYKDDPRRRAWYKEYVAYLRRGGPIATFSEKCILWKLNQLNEIESY